MKRFLSLMLSLVLVLSVGLSLAEEPAYQPGEITKALILEAMQPGHHLSVSLSGVFEPGKNLAENEEQQAILDSVSRLLEQSALRVGYARVADGVRLDFGGYILDEDGSLVYSDNAVTFNHDGIVLESDLMEGRRLFVGWETILEQLGLDKSSYGDLFLEMAEQDVTDWVGGWIEEHAGQAVEAALPYAGATLGWLMSLPFEPVETLPENSPVPALPGMMQVSITRADVSRLGSSLLDQLADPEDKMHSWLLHLPLFTEEDLQENIEWLRDIIASETTDHPLVLTFAMPTGEEPIPFALAAEYEGDIRAFRFGIYGTKNDDGKTMNFALLADGTSKADPEAGKAEDSSFALHADLALTQDPQDKYVYEASFSAEAAVNGQNVLSMTYENASAAFTAESGQPGYRMTMNQAVSYDGGAFLSSSENSAEYVRTEEGGESYLIHGTASAKEGDDKEMETTIVDASWVIEPVEGGLFDAAWSEILSMPAISLESIGMNALVFGDEYEPMDEYLTTIYYDELSGEEIADLESELKDALRAKRNDILEVLPEPLVPYAVQYIGGQIPEDDHDSLGDQGYLDGFMEGYGVGYDDGFKAGLDAARENAPKAPESEAAGSGDTVD
ncbi:MAG: hypothetical protein K5746_03025 [Clostridiales bacterium]|nr:hypothetical protein [Clostridiales bacterium]